MKQLKRRLLLFLALLTALFALSIGHLINRAVSEETIAIGAKNNTEARLVAEMLALLVEDRTGLQVTRHYNFEGTTICFYALKTGQIDLYCEYTGTALLEILKAPMITDTRAALAFVQDAFRRDYALEWLDPLGFNNAYVLVVRKEEGRKLETLSDMAQDASLRVAFDAEFSVRPESRLLKQFYGFDRQPLLMDQVILRVALLNGLVDVISACATDGFLAAHPLQALEDDQHCFPLYLAAPVVSQKVIERFPGLKEVLNLLADQIDDREMQRLNQEVEGRGRWFAAVAREFLETRNLVHAPTAR